MVTDKILIVDDDAFFRATTSDILTGAGYDVLTASNGAQALELVEHRPDIAIVLTDLVMPGLSGIDLLERIKQFNALIDVIMVTGHGTIETAIDALKKGAYDYISKPVHEDELFHAMRTCMERRHFLEENKGMKQSLRLFEASRSVLAVIDINRLYMVSLDAILQAVPAEAGMIACYEGEGEKAALTARALKNMDTDQSETLLAAFKQSCSTPAKISGSITLLGKEELDGHCRTAFGGFNALIIVPIIRNSAIAGYFFLLSNLAKEAITQQDLSGAMFMMEHASLAFENAQKYSDAQEMAFLDSLTGLYNSSYLDMALEKELKRSARLLSPVTVLFIDIDNFKRINDTHDHLVGSRILVEIAKILLQSVRDMDTVVRYGGDEYVVVLGDTDHDKGFRVAERIRSAVEAKNFFADEGLGIKITASIGMATYPVHAKGKKDLLLMADKAMYRAKDISKNAVYLAPLPEAEGKEKTGNAK